MNFISTTPEILELKYYGNDNYKFNLLWTYIGPKSTHGITYYQSKFQWYEVFHDNTDDKNSGIPLAVFCIIENKHISFSLHLSVLEVLEKGQGFGSLIMVSLLDMARGLKYKYFTLYPLNDKVKNFYLKLGLTEHKINGIVLLGTVL
jgi:GNAT superfamily N-acetyltransferase